MPDEREKISVTVVTLNEEKNIGPCLESVAWADEVIVLDSGSTDRTVAIAREHTDKVHVEEWRGYGGQKNRAVELASGPWVLSLDADERVSPDLAEEIRRAAENKSAVAYQIRRKNYYRGQWIRHGGWWPDWTTRLFRKGKAAFSEPRVHESLQVRGETGRLSGVIEHHSFRSAADFLERARSYAVLGAQDRFERRKKAGLFSAVGRAKFMFFKTYLLRAGFLDGAAGMLIAVSNAIGVFYRYMLLREMWRDAERNGRGD
ncbi:MAG: glycosyltransferase family 2 protein [Planctomycetes bacterium]|nr:glycosyltransferase family 2 protein [Planctomycetota bacterium]